MNITVEHTAKNLNVQNHIYHGINNKNCFLNFLKRFVANAQHSQSEIEFRCKNEYINWLYTGFRNINDKLITGSIFIDLKKVFDLVNHECLLNKLEHNGIRNTSLSWFREYLTTGTQRTQFGNEISNYLK